jgi:hypothetical protein
METLEDGYRIFQPDTKYRGNGSQKWKLGDYGDRLFTCKKLSKGVSVLLLGCDLGDTMEETERVVCRAPFLFIDMLIRIRAEKGTDVDHTLSTGTSRMDRSRYLSREL